MNKKEAWPIGITAFIIILIIASSPLKAFQLSMKTDKSTYIKGESIEITSKAIVGDEERLPIKNVTFKLMGPSRTFECSIPHDHSYNGIEIDCDGLIMTVSLDFSMDYGYGYLGAFYDQNYSWGYGYGYGAGGDMTYTIKLSSYNLIPGTYSAEIVYFVGNDAFSVKLSFDLHESSRGGKGNLYPIVFTNTTKNTITTPLLSTTTTQTTAFESVSTTPFTTTTIKQESGTKNPMTGFVALIQKMVEIIVRFFLNLVKI